VPLLPANLADPIHHQQSPERNANERQVARRPWTEDPQRRCGGCVYGGIPNPQFCAVCAANQKAPANGGGSGCHKVLPPHGSKIKWPPCEEAADMENYTERKIISKGNFLGIGISRF